MHKDLNDEFHFIQAGMRLKNRVVLAPLTHNMSAKNGDQAKPNLTGLPAVSVEGLD
ncbi:hypothetical protein LFREDSHE_10430 [Shewanella baltica]